MIDGKKIIGLCLTRINDNIHAEYAAKIQYAAEAMGFRVVLMNSLVDFYFDDSYDEGAKHIYDMLDYNVFDAVVIFDESIYNKSIIESIIRNAKQAGAPVVVVNGEYEGCYCLSRSFEDAYTEVIDHVIKAHNVKNTVFIGGRKDKEDVSTVKRLECYKQALRQNGLVFIEEMVGYGEYWSEPTWQELDRIFSFSSKTPEAIICANDSMATAAVDFLKDRGLRVPEDVIVTGFDGISEAAHCKPRITTCRENISEMARILCETLRDAFDKNEPKEIKYPYEPIITESCGCTNKDNMYGIEELLVLYRRIEDMHTHEDYMHAEVNRLIELADQRELFASIATIAQYGAFVCLNKEFLEKSTQQDNEDCEIDEGEYLVIPSINGLGVSRYDYTTEIMKADRIFPEKKRWMEEGGVYVLTPIYVGSLVCGYYAVRTTGIEYDNDKIKRVATTLNIIMNSVLSHYQMLRMMKNLENAVYTDAMTGLANIKGVTKWFEEFAKAEDNHKLCLTISVYAIFKYTYIYENYGMYETEDVVKVVAKALIEANKAPNTMIAKITEDEFIVINVYDSLDDVSQTINDATASFYEQMAEYNSKSQKDYYIEVNAGCTVVNPGWEASLESYIKLASSELFLNRLKQGMGNVKKRDFSARELYSTFNLLIEKNLFTYHYQPIVDARTGNIFAYEALMRTTGGINMSPLDILDVAQAYDRLYDIEKATMFNNMKRLSENPLAFSGHKLFLNTIPGHFLKADDYDLFMDTYHDYFGQLVFEITEQDTITDDELNFIKLLSDDNGAVQIAVDDYGTGHSNIVNLLRYAPQVLKIDRFLISGINSDTNKQKAVKTTIEFARLNDIKVLAEGVETFEEMQTVISMGFDYIQGFYTSRPLPEPIPEIAENIKNEIIGENLKLLKFDSDNLQVYTAKFDEVIDIVELTMKRYKFINIIGGNVKLVGEKDNTIDMIIKIADGVNANITLENVNIKGAVESTIQLGKGSNTKLTLVGDNTLNKDGIYVPETASLRISGEGNLTVLNNRNFSIGIGTNMNDPYGNITFDVGGHVRIVSTGDKVCAIGGGMISNSYIRFIRGTYDIRCRGMCSVVVGSGNGAADIRIDKDVDMTVFGNSANSVGIGSVIGKASIHIQGKVNATSDGEKSAAIGNLSGDGLMINIDGADVSSTVHCDDGVSIGSVESRGEIRISNSLVSAYGEGTNVTAVGSVEGSVSTQINSGLVRTELLAANCMVIGSEFDKFIVMGGNVNVLSTGAKQAINRFGDKVYPVYLNSESFERQIVTENGSYLYKAERDKELDRLCVYLPKKYTAPGVLDS